MSRATVLALNVGSSNLKAALFRTGEPATRQVFPRGEPAALSELLTRTPADAVGHRVVHGGTRFIAPTRITPDVLAELDRLVPFAPHHLPPALDLIRAVERLRPGLPQVACFDTAFHATLPDVERRFGLPRRFHDEGLKRYGFHGLSYEAIAAQLPAASPRAVAGRTVVCHLGSGASLCGMLGGRSVTTTMGFTPLDGLLMATRCGRLDPGVILHCLEQRGMTVEQVRHLLEHECGLLGVSGMSGDMRVLLAAPSSHATEAVDLFCHTAAKEIGAAAVVLGGLDAVVFTAGVGENSPQVRRRVCDKLHWLGVELDPAANELNSQRLHAPSSRVEVHRLPTDEEVVIARHTTDLLAQPN